MKLHYITISAILLSVTSCADFDKINIDPENSIYVGAGDTGNDSNDDERSTSIDFPETIPDDELAFAKENEASVESDFKTFSYEGMYNDYQKTTNLTTTHLSLTSLPTIDIPIAIHQHAGNISIATVAKNIPD